MEIKRIVNFYFYNVFEVDEQLNKTQAELSSILDKMYDIYNDDSKTKELKNFNNSENSNAEISIQDNSLEHIEKMAYNDEVIRLINVFKNENDYYQLTFERLDHIIPNVSKVLGTSKQLELEDDEYIGHQITVLYDEVKHVFMIQRNISSLSPGAVESFINKLYKDRNDDAKHIEFSLITDKRKQENVHDALEYRDIFVRVTKESSKELFKRLFSEENREINIDYIEFKIKAKKNNDEYISEGIAKEIIKKYENSDDIQKLLVNAKINESERVTLVDVLNQKLQRREEFKRNDRLELNTNEVFSRMVKIYREDVVHVLPS